MKCSKKVCAHEKVIVVLNADKDKYSNYETSISGDTTGNLCVYCHDSEKLNFFGISKDWILLTVDNREFHFQSWEQSKKMQL